MIKPVEITVQMPVKIKAKQPQIIPYLDTKPFRDWFDLERLENQPNRPRMGQGSRGDFSEFRRWSKKPARGGGVHAERIIELTLDGENWRDVKNNKASMLSNPKYKTALYFVGGHNFRKVTDHPQGTEFFVINDDIYRRLTWRSVANKFWDEKKTDCGISWKTPDENLTYFLYKCEKMNKEPLKSTVIDSIGIVLLERDKPVEKDEEVVWF